MKREDLKAIEGLTEEQINAVMRLHGLDAAAHQATVQGLQAQLATAQQGLAAFDGVDVNDLRSQITNLTNQLSQQAAEFAFNGVLRAAAHEAGALTRTMLSHCCRTELHCARARIRLRMSSRHSLTSNPASRTCSSRVPPPAGRRRPRTAAGQRAPGQPDHHPEAPQPGRQRTAHPAGVSPDDRRGTHGPAHP